MTTICPFCHMTTDGQHELSCPLYQETETCIVYPDYKTVMWDRDRNEHWRQAESQFDVYEHLTPVIYYWR